MTMYTNSCKQTSVGGMRMINILGLSRRVITVLGTGDVNNLCIQSSDHLTLSRARPSPLADKVTFLGDDQQMKITNYFN